MPDLRIAAAQSRSLPGDIAANVAQHGQFITQAGQAGVKLLLFPELSLSGYELSMLRGCAIRPDAPLLAPLQALAREYEIEVIVGAPLLGQGQEVFIGAVGLMPNGRRWIYHKQHLHGDEIRFASPGRRRLQSRRLASDRCALAICADSAHAGHAQAASAAGAGVYLASALISPGGYPLDARRLQGYARRHAMAVLLANHGDASGPYETAGRSAFWSAQGDLLVAAPGPGDCLVIASRSVHGWSGEVQGL